MIDGLSLLTDLDRRAGTRIAITGPITRRALKTMCALAGLMDDIAEGPCARCGDERPHRHVWPEATT
jgi:hypothetical protein